MGCQLVSLRKQSILNCEAVLLRQRLRRVVLALIQFVQKIAKYGLRTQMQTAHCLAVTEDYALDFMEQRFLVFVVLAFSKV